MRTINLDSECAILIWNYNKNNKNKNNKNKNNKNKKELQNERG